MDTTASENDLPFTLAPTQSYTNTIFATFAGNAPQGLYSFLYSVDGLGTNFYEGTGSVNFQISTVVNNASAPEPSTLGFLSLSALVSAASCRRKKCVGKTTPTCTKEL